MTYDAIDSAFLAAHDLGAACRPYERLGLHLTPTYGGRRTLHVGSPPQGTFALHFLADPGRGGPLGEPLRRALAAGRALFAVGLRVPDLSQVLGVLASRGVPATTQRDDDPNLAWLDLHERAGTDLVLLQHAAAGPAGHPGHSLRVKRLDHLAAVAHDLEATTRFWSDALGVLVADEVTTPTLVIRQLRIGDAVLELLGPESQDSPIWKRPAGLVSMASWEVDDLDAAVAHARAAGFTVPDPAPGLLPGTRVATIPGADLGGVNMQLLQYV
jgi:catechol 2,3-dioxygenase-like lactoylglutathione lyase family enzyme